MRGAKRQEFRVIQDDGIRLSGGMEGEETDRATGACGHRGVSDARHEGHDLRLGTSMPTGNKKKILS